MTRFEVDLTCGQTPCLCGDIETWHLACFAGKTDAEIRTSYDKAYRIARVKLQTRANQQIARALYSDAKQQAAAVLAASMIKKAADRSRM